MRQHDAEILSLSDLLKLNEGMLKREVSTQDRYKGYNRADYSICMNYFNGLSDAQIADLAERLIKYSETQLHVDKQIVINTYEYYKSLVKNVEREDGVNINITEDGTVISFKYNELFINIIKTQPQSQFDSHNKKWIVPNDKVIIVLNSLLDVGADVENAISHAMNSQIIKESKVAKAEVLTKFDGDYVLLKFDYNTSILNEIKKIYHKDRTWNSGYKFWAIKREYLDILKEALTSTVDFRLV